MERKTLGRQEAVDAGFIIDNGSPPIAYKGPRFNPKEWRPVPTECEEALQADLEKVLAVDFAAMRDFWRHYMTVNESTQEKLDQEAERWLQAMLDQAALRSRIQAAADEASPARKTNRP